MLQAAADVRAADADIAAARAVSVQAYGDATTAYQRARVHVTMPAQRRRLDELVAELPVRPSRAGVA